MEIRWLGHACFLITHNGYTVAIDPYDSSYIPGYPKLQGVRADKLLISHESYGHNYRQAIVLSGRPETDCPFRIQTLEVWHDTVCGIMRGSCRIHILEADGIRVAHMGDIGAPLTGEQARLLYDLDAMMITAGSCTALPAQEVWRLTEELFPKVIIPMHYRDGSRGPRRLEHLEDLTKYFAPDMVRHLDTDRITITRGMEPQIAALKFIPYQEETTPATERSKTWKSALASKVTTKLPWTKRT